MCSDGIFRIIKVSSLETSFGPLAARGYERKKKLATPKPVFGAVPHPCDATDFHRRIRNVSTNAEHVTLVTQFLTNGKNLTTYTLYSVTADILPELEKDRRKIFLEVFKEKA